MKAMNRSASILLSMLLTLFWADALATAQNPDRLIFKGDTLSVFTNPLEKRYENGSLRPSFFGSQSGCIPTSCWRGYVAEWKIKDDQLYLAGIFSCCFLEDRVSANLNDLFGDKVIDGAVKADWFSGSIVAPQGKLLHYVHLGYESIYEKELEFQIKNGRCISTKTYDNSRSRQSIYNKNPTKLSQFIYSNIKWATLPDTDKREVKVFVWFSADENGMIDSVKTLKGDSTNFDREAIRVVKMIPEWDVFYRHGKHEKKGWVIPVIFSSANKEKYKK